MLRKLLFLVSEVQKLIVKNQLFIRRCFYFLFITLIVFFLFSYQITAIRPWWSNFGRKAADLSLIVFWLTLLPGIMRRFQVTNFFLPLRTILMLFRKELGILTYLLALTHYGWSRVFPILLTRGDLLSFSLFEIFGVTAFALATPLFLTSNDWSFKKMGKLWKKLHNLSYIIIWLLFIHIVLRNPDIKALITLVIALLEWSSLFIAKRN